MPATISILLIILYLLIFVQFSVALVEVIRNNREIEKLKKAVQKLEELI